MIKESEKEELAKIVEWAGLLPEADREKALWLIGALARSDESIYRRRLPDTRKSITHKFTIFSKAFGERDYFLTIGMFPDGTPGEIFFKIGLQSNDITTMLDQWAICVSILLQHGIGVDYIHDRFIAVNCEPCGPVKHGDEFFMISFCESPFDYVAKYLKHKFSTLEVE